MRVLLTGATGLIGRELGQRLAARGDTLVCLVRDMQSARRRLPFPAVCHAWEHMREVPAAALEGVDAVVHLAGEPVADARWSAGKKALIRDSRVLGTRHLVRAASNNSPGIASNARCMGISANGTLKIRLAISRPSNENASVWPVR